MFFQEPNLWGRMAPHIIVGSEPMHNVHGRVRKTSVQTTSAYRLAVRVGTLCAVGFAAVLFAGCGELEPMREPEVVELELTTDTLKSTVRRRSGRWPICGLTLKHAVGNWQKLRLLEHSLKDGSGKRNGGSSKPVR
jgi:hypothetical protein